MTPLLSHNIEAMLTVHWSAMTIFGIVFLSSLIGIILAFGFGFRRIGPDHGPFDALPFVGLSLVLTLPLGWSGVTLALWVFSNYFWKA